MPTSVSSYGERPHQLISPCLQRGGIRLLLDGQFRVYGFPLVGHSRPAGQLCQQGLEAVDWERVHRSVRPFLGLGRGGGLRRQDRIAARTLLPLLLTLERRRRPSPPQVPFCGAVLTER